MEPLEQKLRQKIRGEVRFDAGSRALYATDSSNYRQPPVGVVIPRNVEDIVEAAAICREFGAPLLARGAGTSLAGQCCNVAVVVDTSKFLCDILEIDPAHRTARVQPGVVLDRLRNAAAPHGLTFAPDPATHSRCTLGGMIGNNSCGAHSMMGGNTVDNVEELEILTYSGLRLRVGGTSQEELDGIIREGGPRGEIYAALFALRERYADQVRSRFPRIPRRVSGYNLDQLLPENGFHVARALVGTEGTCVTVLEAKVRLVANPACRVLAVLGFRDLPSAADSVELVLSHKPIALEGVGRTMLAPLERKAGLREKIALLPAGNGILLAEFGASTVEGARHLAENMIRDFARQASPPSMKLFEDPRQARGIWEIREVALAAGSLDENGKEFWGGWEDAAVPPERLGEYLRAFDRLLDAYHYHGLPYGHFGQGCIHVRIDFDFRTPEGIRKFRAFVEDAADLVVSFGGSLSGEHGDGHARAELYPRMFGEELVGAFREFKAIWDPQGKMNPGKLVDPYRLDENLRAGPSYQPWQPKTHFSFPDDRGSFERASARCIGIGKCRREDGETMCPSYRVTREEEHSTRGRARLLSEMLRGEVLTGKWRDPHVRRALDLCFACKGCKAECPVSVDMASYKAEFLSHFYRGRLRPLSAYAFGMIFRWARLGSHTPRLANLPTQSPLLSRAIKSVVGIAPERRIPPLARQTFKAWFRRQKQMNADGSPIILWADTFNNYFSPEVLKAAVDVLEAAGFRVIVPIQPLCCGRPLYDYGMLGLARRKLEGVLKGLRPHIDAGVPLVGLEPGCVAVFRDELRNLFPGNKDAEKLASQSFLLGEFLAQRGYRPPPFAHKARKALLHGHCHQKAIMGMDGDLEILRGLGLDFDLLDSGCCGMAGGFGYEKEHYEVSVKAGELALLPAARGAAADTLIITDGFSCREQVLQCTGRRALHLAQVLRMAIHDA
ncbi:MAG: FAD-binding and (Fe-S)-binding domain-containing protein [Terriglobia bacterium]